MSENDHRGIPFQESIIHDPGVKCTCEKFSIKIGDAYPIKRRDGVVVTTQVKTMKKCWDVFRLHRAGLLVTQAPNPLCEHCGIPAKIDTAKARWIHVYNSYWCTNDNGTLGRTRCKVAGSCNVPLNLMMPS